MEEPTKRKMDVGFFNFIIIALSIAFIGYLVFNGTVSVEGVTSNVGGILLNLIVFLVVIYGIEFFQRGFGTNIRDEIYSQNNTAAAIYELGIKVSIALVIAKGFL